MLMVLVSISRTPVTRWQQKLAALFKGSLLYIKTIISSGRLSAPRSICRRRRKRTFFGFGGRDSENQQRPGVPFSGKSPMCTYIGVARLLIPVTDKQDFVGHHIALFGWPIVLQLCCCSYTEHLAANRAQSQRLFNNNIFQQLSSRAACCCRRR